jgi:thymidylate kinase
MTTRDIRKRFITHFFGLLEENGVRYCMLRNYDDLYGNAATDLDMIVSEHSLKCFEQCLRESAQETEFHFVHAARYVNFSWVFWNPLAGFIRVDYETDVRWRVFTVLEAREVLDRSVRHQEFFIPNPEHEIAILFIAALWRGELTDRYRRQLAKLYTACADKDSLRESLITSFGQAGHLLTDFEKMQSTFDKRFFTWLRLSLILRTHLVWPRFPGVLKNFWIDGRRFVERVFNAAGVSLLVVSSNEQQPDFTQMLREIEFLFPIKKNRIEKVDLRAGGKCLHNWRMRMRRVRTMFKGGLYIRAYRVEKDADIPRVIRAHTRHIYSTRTFVCGEDSGGQLYFGHVKSGFMTSVEANARGAQTFSKSFIEFVSDVLERARSLSGKIEQTGKGLFCVLVGLDGSGKTTLGRNLCDLSVINKRFAGVRYFHWRPKCFRHVEWPLPEFRETPRKPSLARNPINTLLSVVRITRNGTLARLAWYLKVRPMVRQGCLVLVDRYFYNYHLDPASVKFSAPSWVLKFMQNLFPAPDLVVKLRAPKDVLLSRKQELSPDEIGRQVERMDSLDVTPARVVMADATLPPHHVARNVMAEIVQTQRRG